MTVNDAQIAMKVRESCLKIASGVIRVLNKYGRGFHVKFRGESSVLIFSNGNTFTHSDVLQMIGRSIRIQGTFKGTILMIDENFLGKEQSWEKIKKRGAANGTVCIPNLQILFDIA